MIKITTTIESNRKRFIVRVTTDGSHYTVIKHSDNWFDAWTFAQEIEQHFNGVRVERVMLQPIATKMIGVKS